VCHTLTQTVVTFFTHLQSSKILHPSPSCISVFLVCCLLLPVACGLLSRFPTHSHMPFKGIFHFGPFFSFLHTHLRIYNFVSLTRNIWATNCWNKCIKHQNLLRTPLCGHLCPTTTTSVPSLQWLWESGPISVVLMGSWLIGAGFILICFLYTKKQTLS